MNNMFWGLHLEPGKRYSTTVSKSFHVSMAALDCSSVKLENEVLSVMLEDGDNNVPFILCNLQKNKLMQSPLDLTFLSGDKITIFCKGSGTVHLSGYIVPEEDDELEQLEEEEEEEGEDVSDVEEIQILKKKGKLNGLQEKRKVDSLKSPQTKKKKLENIEEDTDDSDEDDIPSDDNEDENMILDEAEESDEDDDDDDDEDDEEDDEGGSEEEEEESEEQAPPPQQMNKNKTKGQKQQQMPSGQNKQQNIPNLNKSQNQQISPAHSKQQNQGKQQKTPNGLTPNTQTKKDKKGTPGGTPTINAKLNKSNEESGSPNIKKGGEAISPFKKTLEGGVMIKDLKMGNGPVCKAGKMACVYYTGKLKQNNKVFDATTQGPGFKFRVGKGEVIKGWDVGIVGMKVGGKRLITCPPQMAYGQKGSPPTIPSNSALIFEVELKNIN